MSIMPAAYKELRDVAFDAFEYSKTRGFTDAQAFSFTHHHLGIYIEGSDPWLRLIGSTAAFMVGVKFNVDLSIILRVHFWRTKRMLHEARNFSLPKSTSRF